MVPLGNAEGAQENFRITEIGFERQSTDQHRQKNDTKLDQQN